MRGWFSIPLGQGLRLGISPTRTWFSFPLFGFRAGISAPVPRKRKPRLPPALPAVPPALPGRMPGAYVD
ncbi:hypothetical protein [Bradyrhizobium genosp. P]|uniref:hypothetical protein n=1 Tax=Bradyrhizobium genosp. P TaxID=83641 RepID=UPI003CF7F787